MVDKERKDDQLSQQASSKDVAPDINGNTLSILAISGSLRSASYNSSILRAFARLAPDHINFYHFDSVADIPLFSPDRESEHIDVIVELKRLVATSDGLILASPEYAHGISGVMKNTLDWLVSDESFPYMPVALINTSPRATHAQLALREVIKTMSGILVESASLPIRLLGTELDDTGIVADAKLSSEITQCLATFASEIERLKAFRL